jgi:hypothetical protein
MRAVESGDPTAMAADYAEHAVLERPGEVFTGRAAIEAYFLSVPDRLGGAFVVFDELTVTADTATFRWHLDGANAAASGQDVCLIGDDGIVHQQVTLDDGDF